MCSVEIGNQPFAVICDLSRATSGLLVLIQFADVIASLTLITCAHSLNYSRISQAIVETGTISPKRLPADSRCMSTFQQNSSRFWSVFGQLPVLTRKKRSWIIGLPATRTARGRHQGRTTWTKSYAQTPHSATGAAHPRSVTSIHAYPTPKKVGEPYPKPPSQTTSSRHRSLRRRHLVELTTIRDYEQQSTVQKLQEWAMP